MRWWWSSGTSRVGLRPGGWASQGPSNDDLPQRQPIHAITQGNCGDRDRRPVAPNPYCLSMTDPRWPGGAEWLDLGTAVSHVRWTDHGATLVRSAFSVRARTDGLGGGPRPGYAF